MALEICDKCKWKYPSNLLNQMFIGGSGYTPPICGICALEITNDIHGTPKRKRFDGEIAEHMRLLAIQWRKRNKQYQSTKGETNVKQEAD